MLATIKTERWDATWMATVSTRPFRTEMLKVFVSDSRASAIDLAAEFVKKNGLAIEEVN